MAVCVFLCSSVTVFADTLVDNSYNSLKSFLSTYIYNSNESITSLQNLPDDDYLVTTYITFDSSSTNTNPCVITYFIPRKGRKIVYWGDLNEKPINNIPDDTIFLFTYYGYYYGYAFNGDGYRIQKTSTYGGTQLITSKWHIDSTYDFTFATSYPDYHDFFTICNDTTVVDTIVKNNFRGVYSKLDINTINDKYLSASPNYYEYVSYSNLLFKIITEIMPDYTGTVKDNSFNGLISEYGINCDSTILKQYKYQITYCMDNDIKMMFLNNNKAPKYTATDYNGIHPIARKYTFTYENTYDTIVYFPQYQMYLNYDDWYNNKPEPNDFKWFWENDNKSFSLINDWTVTFKEGAPNYSGTRVIVGWEKSFNAASASMSDAWKIDKDKLINEGWIEGRPNDQNYPYQITIKQNAVPTYQIYMNSKPAIEVDRNNEYQCLYKIQMVPQCGYVYSFWADCYSKFDYTTNLVDGNDIISQGQNYVWNALNTLGAYYDDRCMLHLAENYRGSTDPQSTEYIGTKVFFNWDISSKMINKNDDDDYDYSQLVNTGDKYVDNNGNIHGGSLNNYDSEDLNKYNDNGSSDNNSTSSGNFDFTLEGITSYCSDFFNFIKSVFNLFPSFIWVLVGASIAVLIALRVLGR